MKSPKVCEPLTKLQCCPTSDGAAAVILANEDYVHKHRLESQAIEIVAMTMCTDTSSTFDSQSCLNVVGYEKQTKAIIFLGKIKLDLRLVY